MYAVFGDYFWRSAIRKRVSTSRRGNNQWRLCGSIQRTRSTTNDGRWNDDDGRRVRRRPVAAAATIVPATTIRHATSDDCAATTVLSTTTTAAAATTTGPTDSFAKNWRLARVGRRFRADILLFRGDGNIHLGETGRILIQHAERRLRHRTTHEKEERERKVLGESTHIIQILYITNSRVAFIIIIIIIIIIHCRAAYLLVQTHEHLHPFRKRLFRTRRVALHRRRRRQVHHPPMRRQH